MQCHDCPDFDTPEFRASHPAYRPRARCCLDEHIERRSEGSFDPFEGVERCRLIADREEEKRAGNRQERRAAAAKQRKKART